MEVKRELLNHFIYLQQELDSYGSSAMLDTRSFQLVIDSPNRDIFYPQFICFVDNKKWYTSKFDDQVVRFIGWRPYVTKSVQQFSDKLLMKKIMKDNGFPVPEFSTDKQNNIDGVIIKQSVSSFGDTIRGPFNSASECDIESENGEFYEKFIEGRIIKSWFWNGVPICYEYQEMPKITGDGTKTIEQLANMRLEGLKVKTPLESIEKFVHYQGHKLSDVLKESDELLIDFKYGSKFAERNSIKDVDLKKEYNSDMRQKLANMGAFLIGMAPLNIKQNFAFSVDCILDSQGQLWFLEVNNNPMMHPYLYAPILNSLYAPAMKRERGSFDIPRNQVYR